MKNIIQPNIEVLKWAREQSGFNLEAVAKKLKRKKVTAQTIIEWENGTAFPSYSQLEDLAYKIYKRPLAVFFFPEPPDESDIKKSFRTLLKPVEKLNPEMRFLLRKARVMQLNLMELHDDKTRGEKKITDIRFTSNSSVTSLSKKVREYLNINLTEQKKWKNPDTALAKWREALESRDIFVFKDSFKASDLSGFCLYDSEFPIIYINSKQTSSRQIFTLFHELAHILFHTSGFDPLNENYFRGQLTDANKKIEIMCNEFAGAFLIPEEDFFLNTIKATTVNIANIDQWAKEYSVSPEVILTRIRKKQIISKKNYHSLLNTIQKRYKTLPNKGNNNYGYIVKY